MSTNNFYKKNASKYYACGNEGYQMLENELKDEFSSSVNLWEKDGLRSYDGKIVSQITKNIGHFQIVCDVIIRSGYYAGVNLDWAIMITDENDGMQFEFGYYENKDLPKYMHVSVDNIIKKVEKVFERYSTPLVRTAVLSNGEAIYQKI